MKTYMIIRFYREEDHEDHHKIIKTGLTLEEAQEHCRNYFTSTAEYFDGYEEEK